jgi:hypothetical protein
MYLFTNQYIGISGMYELSDRIIMFDTGLTLKELEACKEELAPKVSFIKGFVYVRNAEKYDPIRGEKNTLLKAKQDELSLIPDEVVSSFDAPSIPHQSPIDGRKGNGIGNGIGNKGESAERGISYLRNIPDLDIIQFSKDYLCSTKQVVEKAQKIINYCESKGKKYTDYKAALRSWLFNDYGKRPPVKAESVPNLPKEQELASPDTIREFRDKAVKLAITKSL